jgi:hypothetical protein
VQAPSVIIGCLHDGPLCGGRGAADLAHRHLAERQHEAVLTFARQRLPNWMGPSFAHRVIQASARLRIVPGSQVAGVRRFASTYQRCLQWDIENVFDELKNQWGWGGFTTQDLHRCRLLAGTVVLVYNWWSLFTRLADPEHHREALTSRPLLLSL